jgi:hypothetical protein
MRLSKTRKATGLLTSMLLIVAWQPSRGEVHATHEFEDGSTRPVSVALLPSQVELVKQKLIRQEAQVEESGELESYLTAATAAEFEARGYQIVVPTTSEIASDPTLQELVVDANRRFGEMRTNLEARLSKTKQVQRRRYNAGDEIKLLAARLGVDAIAFTRMQIIAPAAGVRARNFGLGGETALMSVSIVDGTSGDLEAYITLPGMKRGKMFGGHDDIIENPAEQMGNYAAGTLDDLPQADPSLRVVQTDEDVLADLEALLEE